MITLLEPMDGQAPTHYILNNTSPNTFNTSYNDEEKYEEAKRIDGILYGEDMIESGEIEDLGVYTLVNELDVIKGAESKAKNKVI
tara:strand:+ start:12321 stop:12575 length:255 start_codon:yes stop_codon:yes gene_type:complete